MASEAVGRQTQVLIGSGWSIAGLAWPGGISRMFGLVLCAQLAVSHAVAQDEQPALAVKALMGALDDPEVEVRRSAVLSLGRFGTDAAAAVPALTTGAPGLGSRCARSGDRCAGAGWCGGQNRGR